MGLWVAGGYRRPQLPAVRPSAIQRARSSWADTARQVGQERRCWCAPSRRALAKMVRADGLARPSGAGCVDRPTPGRGPVGGRLPAVRVAEQIRHAGWPRVPGGRAELPGAEGCRQADAEVVAGPVSQSAAGRVDRAARGLGSAELPLGSSGSAGCRQAACRRPIRPTGGSGCATRPRCQQRRVAGTGMLPLADAGRGPDGFRLGLVRASGSAGRHRRRSSSGRVGLRLHATGGWIVPAAQVMSDGAEDLCWSAAFRPDRSWRMGTSPTA